MNQQICKLQSYHALGTCITLQDGEFILTDPDVNLWIAANSINHTWGHFIGNWYILIVFPGSKSLMLHCIQRQAAMDPTVFVHFFYCCEILNSWHTLPTICVIKHFLVIFSKWKSLCVTWTEHITKQISVPSQIFFLGIIMSRCAQWSGRDDAHYLPNVYHQSITREFNKESNSNM